jgi:2-polyprenyl-6-methoxyphenol hydroxylase-like FAD-dependent oxidoreductase
MASQVEAGQCSSSDGMALRACFLVGSTVYKGMVADSVDMQHSYGRLLPMVLALPSVRLGLPNSTRAIFATLPRTLSSNTTAYQLFLSTGPIAFLPPSPTASSLVWSTPPALAAVLTKTTTDPAILTSAINAAFRPLRERAHAILPHSALASSNIHPSDASVGIPGRVESIRFRPLIAGIQPGTIASFPNTLPRC